MHIFTTDEIHVKFTEKQQKQIAEYIQNHACEEFCKSSGNFFGSPSKVSFIVGRNGIGGSVAIYCPYCKTIIDITDIDMW